MDPAEEVIALERFLIKEYPECVLMPSKANDDKYTDPAQAKQPLMPHKDVPTRALWDNWARNRHRCDKGLLIILRAGLLVIDVDDKEYAKKLETEFPMILNTAIQDTRTGRHYFFQRTEACDQLCIYDGARCLFEKGAEEPLPVDIKSVCSTGTGGVISVSPSPNKKWVRAPFNYAPIPLPAEVLMWIITRHRSFTQKQSVAARTQQSQLRSKQRFNVRDVSVGEESTVEEGTATSRGPEVTEDQQSWRSLGSVGSSLMSTIPYEHDPETVRNLVMTCLALSRAKEYDSWVKVGMALKNTDDGYFDLWVDFSKRCPEKFASGGRNACAEKWASFSSSSTPTSVVTMGSIIEWARQDNPDKFHEVMDVSVYSMTLRSSVHSHSSVAVVAAAMYSKRYVCVKAPRMWYKFEGHRWVLDEGAHGIWAKLRDDLPRLYLSVAGDQQRRAQNAEDDEKRKTHVDAVKRLNDVAKRLGNQPFKDSLVRECASLMFKPQWSDELDENRNLLGFSNGVYDLDAGVFRPGDPKDMLSMTCGYAFTEVDDPIIQSDIKRFVASTQASSEMENYLWQVMAYMLHGDKYMELLWFWTGQSGRNGKGTLTTLLMHALGNYFYAPDAGVFMHSDRNSSGAKPEIVRMRGVRAVIASEPDDSEGNAFKVHKLKAWRGNDVISARGLYQATTSFKPQFSIAICMNDKPQLDKVDAAIASTLRIIDFPYEFVPEQYPQPWQPYQKLMDCGLKAKFSDVRYHQQFMRLLMKTYHDNAVLFRQKQQLSNPAPVAAATRQYMVDNDAIGQWLNARYDRTDDPKDRYTFTELLKAYKEDENLYRVDRNIFKKALLHNKLAFVVPGNVATVTGIRRKNTFDPFLDHNDGLDLDSEVDC